jgi:hypothetical protein
MERTARVTGIPVRRWTNGGRIHRIPTVLHQAWRAPDGTLGLVAANWTDRPVTLRIADRRFAAARTATMATAAGIATEPAVDPASLALPARACLLLR